MTAPKTYHIAEIFPSLQGEGTHTGMAAVFVRFSGCNLRCDFCDTDFSARMHLSLDELVSEIRKSGIPNVILTGGEPGLQLDSFLVERLHAEGLKIHVETNGTCTLPEGLDWIVCSPKSTDVRTIALERADEVKVVYTWGEMPDDVVDARIGEYDGIIARLCPQSLRLQPCDTLERGTTLANTKGAISYILRHNQWRLSLQTHKYLNIR